MSNFPVPCGTISIYKNTVYKNIEAGIYQKIKNMLRIFKAEISKNVKNIEPQLKKMYSYKKSEYPLLDAYILLQNNVQVHLYTLSKCPSANL